MVFSVWSYLDTVSVLTFVVDTSSHLFHSTHYQVSVSLAPSVEA